MPRASYITKNRSKYNEYMYNHGNQEKYCTACRHPVKRFSWAKHILSKTHRDNEFPKTTFIIPDNVINLMKTKYELSSIRSMQYTCKKLLEILDEDTYSHKIFLTDFDRVKKAIVAQSKSKYTQFAFLLKNLFAYDIRLSDKLDIKVFVQELWKLSKQKDQQYQEPTKKEKENYIDWQYFEKHTADYQRRAENKPLDFELQQGYILMLFLTQLPVLRAEDYADIPFEFNAKTPNYYNHFLGHLVLTKYKTSKHHGTRVINLTSDIISQIEYIKKTFNTKYLFCQLKDQNKPMSPNNMSNFIKSVLQKPIGFQMMRKMYISKMLDENKSAKERQDIAHIMAHNLQTQQFYYSRLSSTLHPELEDKIEVIRTYIFSKSFLKAIRKKYNFKV